MKSICETLSVVKKTLPSKLFHREIMVETHGIYKTMSSYESVL